MYEQINIFNFINTTYDVPIADSTGKIASDLLIPECWEAWHYYRSDCTLNNGPYIINALLVILPGNRLYVKEWMKYPFMYELKSRVDVEKMYQQIRLKIVGRMENNSDSERTWQTDTLPTLEDMYKYKDGEYSCKEYADKILFGYKTS